MSTINNLNNVNIIPDWRTKAHKVFLRNGNPKIKDAFDRAKKDHLFNTVSSDNCKKTNTDLQQATKETKVKSTAAINIPIKGHPRVDSPSSNELRPSLKTVFLESLQHEKILRIQRRLGLDGQLQYFLKFLHIFLDVDGAQKEKAEDGRKGWRPSCYQHGRLYEPRAVLQE